MGFPKIWLKKGTLFHKVNKAGQKNLRNVFNQDTTVIVKQRYTKYAIAWMSLIDHFDSRL